MEKIFVIKFSEGNNITEGELSDVIYQGLQFYEDIEWTTYNVTKEATIS